MFCSWDCPVVGSILVWWSITGVLAGLEERGKGWG